MFREGLFAFFGKLISRAARCEAPPPILVQLPDDNKQLGQIAADHIQKEELFRAMVENAWEVVACLGPDSKILYTTDSVTRIFQYTADELVGRLAFDLVAEEDRPRIMKLYEELVFKSPKKVARFRIVSKSGERRWIHCTGVNLLANSAVKSVVIYYHDITRSIEKERTARKNSERLSLALKASKMGTFDWDFRTGRMVCSNVCEALHGFSPGEFKGIKADIFSHAAPGEAGRVGPIKEEAIRQGKEYSVEYKIIHRDGGQHWVMTRGQPQLDAKGEPVRVLGVTVDITEQKEIEQRLRAASQAKSQFLANMSHEIRTPLGAILGFTELIRDENISNEDRIHYAEIVLNNGHQLATIVNDILDISKVEAGKLDVQVVSFSLASLVAETASFLRPLANAKQVNLKVAPIPKEVPKKVSSDPARIKQVLTNIIGNAIKFSLPGGEITVELGTWSAGSHACAMVDVHDTGIGIDEQRRNQIFDLFFQADSSMTRKYGGTGLGLTLSKQLAKLLRGNLYLIRSEVGKGTTFRFTFDMNLPEKHFKKEKPASATPRSIRGTRVLLAEDSPDNQLLISHLLTKEGAVVDTVENGRQAVDQASAKNYEVILMDIQMPVLDGYQATKLLRRRGYRGKIVALTAHALVEEREHSFEVGCDDHLTKPINRKELIEAVATPPDRQNQLS